MLTAIASISNETHADFNKINFIFKN